MELNVAFDAPGLADGRYGIRAKGSVLASIHWGDGEGPWEDWTALAYVPIDPYGTGLFRLTGGRATPPEATHIYAKAVSSDFRVSDQCSCELRPEQRGRRIDADVCFSVVSDIHVSNKPGHLYRAIKAASGTDALLVLGDLVNDGLPDQFQTVRQIMEGSGIPILTVAGNHDFPVSGSGRDYWEIQSWLLERASRMGNFSWEAHESGAWVIRCRDSTLIGIQTASEGRKVSLRGPDQLQWLDDRLSMANHPIVLSHAPLLTHNPNRGPGRCPYFPQNAKLQTLLDSRRGVLFLSGHLHVSPNSLAGCFESDGRNYYYSDGSICPTKLRGDEPVMPSEWTNGVFTDLCIGDAGFSICARSLQSGKKVSRGYYQVFYD